LSRREIKLRLIMSAGRDATEAFEDVGHSDEARGYLPPMYIGDFEKDGVCPPTPSLPCRIV
jgi:cytochrome b involved in lipid metabolism